MNEYDRMCADDPEETMTDTPFEPIEDIEDIPEEFEAVSDANAPDLSGLVTSAVEDIAGVNLEYRDPLTPTDDVA